MSTDRMAVVIGYHSADGIPTKRLDPRTCALCGRALLMTGSNNGAAEDTFRISCGHAFHEFCLTGWCMVGKKSTCPYCKERFNMKEIYRHPSDPVDVVLNRYFDLLRYLVAWQPLVLYADQLVYDVLELDKLKL